MNLSPFEEFDLSPELLKALEKKGYTRPTAIQLEAIPAAMEERDVLGSAPTGTGKTAAFLLPAIQHLLDYPRRKPGNKNAAVLLVSVGIGTFCFVQALKAAGGSSTGLDGLTTIITVAAQLLMILRYREQWLLWIVLNVLSILLWAEQPAMYLMYSAYLLNSLYGYYNWTKLVKAESH